MNELRCKQAGIIDAFDTRVHAVPACACGSKLERPMRLHFVAAGATALGLTVGCADAVHAATDAERLQLLEQRLQQSLTQIEQLQRRLADLERKPAANSVAAAPPSTPSSETERRIETVERSVREVSAALAQAKPAEDTGVPLHGFLDLNHAKFSSSAPAGTRNGFKLGVLDFYLTPQFGANVRSLIELAFEYDDDGSLAVDAERLQIGYAFGDSLVLWAGRFHTPYGYWNTAFHHGAQIQTSITRPRFLGFEDQGGILPSHSVGLWATGKLATDVGRVSYDAYVSNGNRISDGVLDFNAGGDDNSSLAAGFNLGLALKAVPGLTLGVHGQRQSVAGENSDRSQSGRARMQFLGGYGFFENDDWEVIGEYYRFRDRNLDASVAGKLGSWAGYLQAGYNLAPRWVGFVRWEKASLSSADPYFALQDSGRSYRQASAGLRFELDPRASLKLQLDRLRDPSQAATAVNALRAQYAIRF